MMAGHAGAMLQARQLGNELVVGIHSDEAILENKGPTVMTLEERYFLIPTIAMPYLHIIELQQSKRVDG
jgi:cytidyltransferase-like protein